MCGGWYGGIEYAIICFKKTRENLLYDRADLKRNLTSWKQADAYKEYWSKVRNHSCLTIANYDPYEATYGMLRILDWMIEERSKPIKEWTGFFELCAYIQMVKPELVTTEFNKAWHKISQDYRLTGAQKVQKFLEMYPELKELTPFVGEVRRIKGDDGKIYESVDETQMERLLHQSYLCLSRIKKALEEFNCTLEVGDENSFYVVPLNELSQGHCEMDYSKKPPTVTPVHVWMDKGFLKERK